MKHIKIHSFTHLLHLLYCLILALPLCAILARCLYVQFNKNAFESYSGSETQLVNYQTNYKYVTNEVNSIDDLIEGHTYFIEFDSIYTEPTRDRKTIFNDNYGLFNLDKYIINNGDTSTCNVTTVGYQHLYDFMRINDNQNSENLIFACDSYQDTPYTQCWSTASDTFNVKLIFTIKTIYNLSSWTTSYTLDYVRELPLDYNDIVSVTPIYQEVSTLDNAFEYSLNEFVNYSNVGRLNLVNWFTDVFLDSSNATNMLYLNFINWYMNYALLVSCVYILFLVLMWFVSLARRLIYKGMEI